MAFKLLWLFCFRYNQSGFHLGECILVEHVCIGTGMILNHNATMSRVLHNMGACLRSQFIIIHSITITVSKYEQEITSNGDVSQTPVISWNHSSQPAKSWLFTHSPLWRIYHLRNQLFKANQKRKLNVKYLQVRRSDGISLSL